MDLVVKWAHSGWLPLGIREPEENGKPSVEIFVTFNAVLLRPRNTPRHGGRMICTKLNSVFPRNSDSIKLDLVFQLLDESTSAGGELRVTPTELVSMEIAMKVEESRVSIPGFYIFHVFGAYSAHFQRINAYIRVFCA